MTITARVHNRAIALPPDLEIEEGLEVAVIVPEGKAEFRPKAAPAGGAETAEMTAFKTWLNASIGIAKGRITTDERMRETRGED